MECWMDLGDSVSQVGSDKSTVSITYLDIATKLIHDKMLLTALELHLELIENGKELSRLTQFFSNPANFEFQARNDLTLSIPRSSSQATLDSLDFTRCSEDGERTAEDRVAVLEFELRKANEKINSLRANLTVATECDTPTSDCDSVLNDIIKPHEQRALNFLINEYLLMSGYKLTSITFADQNEHQDFEDWDDVGLNVGKPAGLLHIYRNGFKSVSVCSSACQTDMDLELLSVDSLVKENNELKEKLLISQKEKLELVLDCEERFEGEKVEGWTQCVVSGCDRVVQTDDQPLHLTGEALHQLEQAANQLNHISFNNGFEREIAGDICRLETWDTIVSSEMLVETLAAVLINIVNSSAVTSKQSVQELVVLLIHLIVLYPDAKERDNLMQCLLNIKKRPLQDDRNLIVSGLVRIARSSESEGIIESHLLPQCWDLMTNKYPEKRLLVVQICTHISLYISTELRNSLLISVLQQLLLEDREESVRQDCVQGLSLIAAFITDPHKYTQIEELTMKALDDGSERVCEATLKYLLPVLGRWALDSGQLQTHLVPSLLSLIQSQIKRDRFSGIRGLTCILPHLVIWVACDEYVLSRITQDLPPAQNRVGFSGLCTGLSSPVLFYSPRSDESVGAIMRTFDHCIRSDETWPALQYLTHTMLPQILNLLECVEESNEPLILYFVHFFKHLFAGFGNYLLQNQVKEIFMNGVDRLEGQLMDVSKPVPCLSLIPVFVLALLAPLQVFTGEEVGEWLEKLLVALSLSRSSLAVLHIIFKHISKSNDLLEPVLAAIWKGVVHSSSEVKTCSSELLYEVVPNCSEQIVHARVVPALITLAADPNLEVRVSTLPTFGLIIHHSNNKEVLDKILLQVQSILGDSALLDHHQALLSAVSSLPAISAHCPQSFREQTILLNLSKYVDKLRESKNETCRRELCASLVDAYSNIIYTSISTHSLANLLSPLRELSSVCSDCLASHLDTVIQMERDVDSRSRSTPTSPQQRFPREPVIQSNVEDMRNKMTKMFTSPISKPNIPNLPNFFKKKS